MSERAGGIWSKRWHGSRPAEVRPSKINLRLLCSCGSPWLVSAGVARTEQLAAAYAAKAVGAIRRLEPSEPRAALIALTQQVLTRSK